MAKTKAAKQPIVAVAPPDNNDWTRLVIPVGDLVLNDTNARKGHRPDPQLLASIQAHGLLQPLLVQAIEAKKGEARWQVVDGGRRFITILDGIKRGVLSMSAISCRSVQSETQAKELSVAANFHKAMHPMDMCEAILELAKTAEEEIDIAKHFNMTVLQVQKHSALGQLVPDMRQLFRDDMMDLRAAIAATRLSDEDQVKLAKRGRKTKDLREWDIRQVVEQKGVDAELALFNWRKDYPKEKVQASLFDDVNLLLDPALFMEMQDVALNARIAAYKEAGYSDVILLKPDDYMTEGKYLQNSKPTKDKSKSVVLVKARRVGYQIVFLEDMLSRKGAKVTQTKKGGKDAGEAVDLKANELNHHQIRILAGMAMAALRKSIEGEGGKQNDMLLQYIVVSQQFSKEARWVAGDAVGNYNWGSTGQWAKLKKDAPEDFAKLPDAPLGVKNGLTFAEWQKMSPAQRQLLYRHAVASMVIPINETEMGDLKAALKDLPLKVADWCVPGVNFLSKYRTDQLLDYLKKSGGSTPIDTKKSSALACARDAAHEKKAYRFGLD
jgi:ParB-like chromosome segregation protein Spo0J